MRHAVICHLARLALLAASASHGVPSQADAQSKTVTTPGISRARSSGGEPLKTFLSQDGKVQIRYPRRMIACVPKEQGSCGCASWPSLICLSIDGNEKTTFVDVTLEVNTIASERLDSYAADKCLTPGQRAPGVPDFYIDAKKPTVKLGGVLFLHGKDESVAAGTDGDIDVYRGFHAGQCYEVLVTIRMTSLALFEPGDRREISDAEFKSLNSTLAKALQGIRFKASASARH